MRLQNPFRNKSITKGPSTGASHANTQPLSPKMELTIADTQTSLGNCADLIIHRFNGCKNQCTCALLLLKSFTDVEQINKAVLSPLQQLANVPEDMQHLSKILPQTGTYEAFTKGDLIQSLVSGNAILLISGFTSALVLPLTDFKQRPIAEPEAEKVVRGPRDGFVESIWTNIGLIRRRIRNPALRVETTTLGTRTAVNIAVIYLQDIANAQIIEELRARLRRIKIDRIISAGELGEFITDSTWSPFPTVQFTERPDRLTSLILDGKIAILCDGTPVVLVIPAVFWDFLKSTDDYIENQYFASFVRGLRLVGLLSTLLLPGAFVALTTIHLQMLPQSLAVIISGARIRAPLPVSIEVLLMELTVEILREASLRIPGVFGQTISIVGALVIGDAAVTAGLVGPLTVILIAFTTLASFTVPGYSAAVAIRLLRFPLIILSSFLGFFGLTLGAVLYLTHLVSLRSFGVPYFSPVAPLFTRELTDLFVRLPWWLQRFRPRYLRTQDPTRQGPKLKPGPEQE